MFHWLRNSRAAAGEKPRPLLCREKPSRLSLRLGTHNTRYLPTLCVSGFCANVEKEVFFSPILVHKGSKRKIFTVWLQPKYLMCRAARCAVEAAAALTEYCMRLACCTVCSAVVVAR